jgi:hypothetical protein
VSKPTEADQPEACEACLWETLDLTLTDCACRGGRGPFTPDAEKTWAWLCLVCRSSYSGMAFQYPMQYENATTLHMIAWGINRILAELKGDEG